MIAIDQEVRVVKVNPKGGDALRHFLHRTGRVYKKQTLPNGSIVYWVQFPSDGVSPGTAEHFTEEELLPISS